MHGCFGNSQKFSGPNLASMVDIPILLQTFWPKLPDSKCHVQGYCHDASCNDWATCLVFVMNGHKTSLTF